LTKEALVRAFNDDGIVDLEGAAEHMLKRIKKDIELQKTEPRLDGQALLFIPIVEADGSGWLQVFHDGIRPVVAGYPVFHLRLHPGRHPGRRHPAITHP
jgi:hypothetical protein